MAQEPETALLNPNMPPARREPGSPPGSPIADWQARAHLFLGQPAIQRAMPAMAAATIAGIVALAWITLSSPAQRPVSGNASEADRAAMSEALQQSGIEYSVDSGTGALMVAEDDYYQARMFLAAQGLPKGATTATELMDAIPMGASRAVEAERLRQSREQDLARTIEAIDVVRSARVHIAEPSRSAFIRSSSGPAASVMVALYPGRVLSDEQERGIVQLVSGSQPNLDPARVSLIDQNGALLSGGPNNGLGNIAQSQLAAQIAAQQEYRQSIIALLTPVLGEGNFTTEVHVDLDFAEVQATREGYPTEPRALRSEEGEMSTENGSANVGGIPGALSNQPPPPSSVTSQPSPTATSSTTASGENRRTENYSRNFAVSREVSVTHQQSPSIRRVTVAVVVRNAPNARGRSAQELSALERLVKGAVGFDEARGDSVALDARAFTPPVQIEQSWMDSPWVMSAARNGAALLVCILLIFFIGRPLLKRSKNLASSGGQPALIGLSGAHNSNANERASLSSISLELIEANRDFETRAGLVRGFVRQDPARAALVVRDLISSDTKAS